MPQRPTRAQHLVAAHRKARQRHALQSIARNHFRPPAFPRPARDRSDRASRKDARCRRSRGCSSAPRSSLRAQARLPVPITYCELLEPSRPCTMISVSRFCRSGLPVAMAQNPHFLLNLEEPLLRLRQAVGALQKVSGNRLCIAAAQEAARHKVIGARLRRNGR